jgi:cobalt-zinc-cadmium efflux system outer membrane protein
MIPNSQRTALAAVLLMFLLSCGTSKHERYSNRLANGSSSMAMVDPGSHGEAPDPFLLSDESGKLVLSDLLRSAIKRSPKLRGAREATSASKYRRAQVTALPDPMLKLGWYAESIETRTGSQEFAVGLTQSFPWPQKLSVAGDIADIQSNQARVNEWVAVRDVIVGLTRNYHELSYLIQADLASAELEALWADLVARAAGTEKISASEIARAETRLAQTRYDRLVLQELALVQKERIRSTLAVDDKANVGTPRVIALPSLTTELKELRAALLIHNQEILLAQLKIEEARAKEDLAGLSRMPDFSIGGRYIVTDPRTDASPRGNGNDPFIAELGIKIPLQQGAKNARIAEARHRTDQAAFSRDSVVQKLRANLAEAFFKARNQHRLLRLHQETLSPQAERAAREAEATLERGGSGIAGLVETIAARHQVRIGALRARADYAISLSRIEQLIGTPLGRLSAPDTEKTP